MSRDRLTQLCVVLCSAGMACFESSDGDLGFHLATGREVLRTGRIPATNVLSFTEPDHVWRLHQWLPGVLFELIFQRLGITGVIALKMVVVGATWGIVYVTARKLGASTFASAIACLLAAMASAFRFEARPYLFTHWTLALSMLCIASYLRAREAPTQRRALLGMTVVAVLATQLHAGALDSFIVMALAAVGCSVQPLHQRWLGAQAEPASGLAHAQRLGLAVIAAAALSAITLATYHPIGPKILLFPFEMGSNAYLAEHLVEFRAPWRFPFTVLAALWLWLLVLAFTLVTRARLLHAALLGCVLAYALLSLRFARMAFALGIVSAPLVALAFSRAPLSAFASVRPALRDLTFAALLAIAPLYVFRDHAPGFGYSPLVWPRGHFAFIEAQKLRGHAYVSNGWAGPFLGRFYPQRKSFFDARLEAYSPELLHDVYQSIAYGRPGWDAKLARYDVQILLLRYTTPGEARLQHRLPNLRQQLVFDPRFVLVRFDDEGELFVRNDGPNAEVARRFGIPGVDPDRRGFTGRPASAAPALLRAIHEGNRAATLQLMAAIATADAGQLPLAAALIERADPNDPLTGSVRDAINRSRE